VAAPASTAYYGPRFDYDPVTLAPKGLLIEEQRTNLLTYSEQFDNAAWSKGGATITANTTVSPDGALTADKLVEAVGPVNVFITSALISFTSGAVYTFSTFAKAGERVWFALRFPTTAFPFSNRTAWFNLSTGVTGTVESGVTASISAVGDGWYRCSITVTANATATGPAVMLMGDSDNSNTYTGDGTSGLFIWGGQVELGAFQTSYVPSVASQVTRAADNASMIGNNFARWYNVNEGSVFVGFKTTGGPLQRTGLSISDGTTSNRVISIIASSGSTRNIISSGGVSTVDLTYPGPSILNLDVKNAYAFKADDFATSLNGGAVQTDASVTLPVFVDRAYIGALESTGSLNQINGTISRIAYFNRRLADSELQGITS
jgi:hypothetical protein